MNTPVFSTDGKCIGSARPGGQVLNTCGVTIGNAQPGGQVFSTQSGNFGAPIGQAFGSITNTNPFSQTGGMRK